MLRSATPCALLRLAQAATGSDRELDAALIDLGVLPPLDLDQIRACVQRAPNGLIAGTNADGHRLLTLVDGDRTIGWIHHDGCVAMTDPEPLEA